MAAAPPPPAPAAHDPAQTIEVDATTEDESLKIANINLSPQTIKARLSPISPSIRPACALRARPCSNNTCLSCRTVHSGRLRSRRVTRWLQALEKRGVTALFPIQKSVFDPAMAGQDLVGRARTGSGKTLAFALPIIEGILKDNLENNKGRGRRPPRAVVLAPTRELAKQVRGSFCSI